MIRSSFGREIHSRYKYTKAPHSFNLRVAHTSAPATQERFKLSVSNPVKAPKPKALPRSVDLRSRMPPVYNQGSLGSCTANALATLVQLNDPTLQGSRLFLYYNERMIDGTIPDDAGAYLYDGIASLEDHGICPETMWPYDIQKFAVTPPDPCYVNAETHQVLASKNLAQNATAMKTALNDGHPFCVGIAIFPEFLSTAVARTGVVSMPPRRARMVGGHAVVVVGYNDSTQRWILRNSWGASWGQKGYFTLPYAYLLNPSYASDMWIITNIEKPGQ